MSQLTIKQAARNLIEPLLVFSIFLCFKSNNWWFLRRTGFPIEQNIDLIRTYEQTHCGYFPCPGYCYGRALYFVLSRVHLSQEMIGYSSSLLTFAFLLVLTYTLLLEQRVVYKIFLLIVLFAPPTQFLLLSMNIDVLCFILLSIAALLKRKMYSIILITMAVSLKYYALFCFLPLLVSQIRYKNSYKIFLRSNAVIFSIFVIFIADYLTGPKPPNMGPLNAFGLQVFGAWVRYLPHHFQYLSLGTGIKLVSYLSFLVTSVLFSRTNLAREIGTSLSLQRVSEVVPGIVERKERTSSQRLNQLLLTVGIGCYLLTINYDFRLIFITLPAIRIGFEIRSKLLLTLVCTSTFLTQYNFEQDNVYVRWVFQILGDISLFFLVCFLISPILFHFRSWFRNLQFNRW